MELKTSARGETYVIDATRYGDSSIAIVGKSVRRERTGVHAFISLTENGTVLAYHEFNIGDDTNRVRLVNSAHAALNGSKEVVPKKDLKYRLDIFCLRLFETWTGQRGIEMLGGNMDIPTASHVLRPFVIRDGGSVLFGPPGHGKSYLTLLAAVSTDAGDDVPKERRLWSVPAKKKSAFVNLERSKRSLEARLARVNRALGLPPERKLAILQARGLGMRDIADALYRDVRERGIEVLYLDSITRMGLGDLNENTTGNRAVDMLSAACPTWLAIGHSPRGDDTHLYGSQMFDAGEDVGVQIKGHQRREEQGFITGVRLRVVKANDVPTWPAEPDQYIALRFGDSGESLIEARHSSLDEFPELVDRTEGTPVDRITQYVKTVGKATTATTAKETGLSTGTVSAHFTKRDGAFTQVGRDGHEVFYGLRETRRNSWE